MSTCCLTKLCNAILVDWLGCMKMLFSVVFSHLSLTSMSVCGSSTRLLIFTQLTSDDGKKFHFSFLFTRKKLVECYRRSRICAERKTDAEWESILILFATKVTARDAESRSFTFRIWRWFFSLKAQRISTFFFLPNKSRKNREQAALMSHTHSSDTVFVLINDWGVKAQLFSNIVCCAIILKWTKIKISNWG